VTPEETGKKDIANINLLYSRALLTTGDYKGALKEIQGILSLSPNKPFRDEALFQAGLIYAHHLNPEKDFKKSLGYFSKLIKDHPGSPLVEQAKIWVGVLDVIEKSKEETGEKDIANINLLYSRGLLTNGDYKGALKEIQGILSLSPNNPYRDEALFQAGLIYAHHLNPEKNFKTSLGYFTKLIKDHPGSPLAVQANIWMGVLDVIEQSKQVDIEIEKKRKQLTQ
jgi:tetratricopeptide (TPR) repeat protein